MCICILKSNCTKTAQTNNYIKSSFSMKLSNIRYNKCFDWLRKLDLNQRPSGYETVNRDIQQYTLKIPSLRELRKNSEYIVTQKESIKYFTSSFFCRSVKTMTKKTAQKTAQKIHQIKNIFTVKDEIISLVVLKLSFFCLYILSYFKTHTKYHH